MVERPHQRSELAKGPGAEQGGHPLALPAQSHSEMLTVHRGALQGVRSLPSERRPLPERPVQLCVCVWGGDRLPLPWTPGPPGLCSPHQLPSAPRTRPGASGIWQHFPGQRLATELTQQGAPRTRERMLEATPRRAGRGARGREETVKCPRLTHRKGGGGRGRQDWWTGEPSWLGGAGHGQSQEGAQPMSGLGRGSSASATQTSH